MNELIWSYTRGERSVNDIGSSAMHFVIDWSVRGNNANESCIGVRKFLAFR